MIETPTLEVPKTVTLEDVLPDALKLSTHDKLVLIRILVEDLIKEDLLSPLKQERTVEIWTPYNSFGAGHILAEERARLDKEPVESSHAIPILDPQSITR